MAIAERILVTLINLSWQLALVFILAWLLAVTFKMRSASARHVIWLAVVLCPVLLVPMNIVSSDIVLLRTGESGIGATMGCRFELTGQSFDPDGDSFPTVAPVEDSSPSIVPIKKPTEGEPLGKSIPSNPRTEASSRHRLSQRIRIKPTALLIPAWIFGVGVGITLIFAGYFRLRKLISQAHEIGDEAVLRIFHQVKKDVGMSRSVRLFTSDKAQAPFSIGFIHPCIILPARMLSSDEKLRMVLIHEIVHLKRFDYLVNLICRVVGSFMFFHPLFHLAARELRISSEQICDGWAIRLTGTREDYANCLMELSRSCVGRLPIGFGKGGSSMTRRIKSIFKDGEVFTMIGRRSMIFLSVSAFFLILTVSAIRLVNSASAGQPSHISRVDRFQSCENMAEAGFFWVDTTTGKTWRATPRKTEWLCIGQPAGAKDGEIGTYMPCPNKCGPGLFIVKTTTGEVWSTRGHEQTWVALELGKPGTAQPGDVGTYMPCEKNARDMPGGFGGLFILNTATGSGWWTPPSNEQNRYPTMALDNLSAGMRQIGTYVPYKSKSSRGLFVVSTTTGEAWWANRNTWDKLDSGKAKKKPGTYMPRDSRDGAGIFILSTKTGEGWWTKAPEASAHVEETSKRPQDEVTDTASSFLRKELDKARQRLFAAEEALVAAQEKDVLDSLTGENNILISGLAKLKADLVEIELQLQEAESELGNAMRHTYTSPEITKLQGKLVDLKIQYKERAEEYTDEHPQAKALQMKIAQMERELQQAISTAQQQGIAAKKREWEGKIRTLEAKRMWLSEKIAEYDHELRGLPRRQMVLARLQREKAIAENTYSMLSQRLNQMELPGKPSEKSSWVLIDESHRLILKIGNPEGATYGTMVLNDQAVSMETLLESFQRAAPKEKKMLIIQAGRDVSHDQIVGAMDLAKRAGIEKIGFAVTAGK